ncbi:MAG: ribosome maturation factor RimM [Dehalococcoidales bacterium]
MQQPPQEPRGEPPGVFYLHQIEGLEVFTEQGENLGRVKEILKTGANDVYVVQGSKGEILLPAIPQVIREVRLEEGRMVVRLMEGLA